MKRPLINQLKIMISLSVLVILFIIYKKKKNFVSHSNEPKVGDKVKNNNPSCKHFKSIGTVKEISSLDNDTGKVIKYTVMNDGPTFCEGQDLIKTMDQLQPF